MTHLSFTPFSLLILLLASSCGSGGGGGGAEVQPKPQPKTEPAVLIKDLDTTPEGRGSEPSTGIEFAGAFYFSASRPETGQELFRTDGTVEGTTLVKDILVGKNSSRPIELVKDLSPGQSTGSNPKPLAGNPTRFVHCAGKAFFRATTEEHGSELWRTDGTAAGTSLALDIAPGFLSSQPSLFFSPDGTTGYFFAEDPEHGRELWQVRANGAVQFVFDFNPGPADGVQPTEMEVFEDQLLLVADDGISDTELFRVPIVR